MISTQKLRGNNVFNCFGKISTRRSERGFSHSELGFIHSERGFSHSERSRRVSDDFHLKSFRYCYIEYSHFKLI